MASPARPRAARARLSAAWVRWIGENLARGVGEDTLAATLAERGTDPEAAREAVAAVERRAGVGPDEFFADYYGRNRPVVLTDLMDGWPALERWTLGHLREAYGDRVVNVQVDRRDDPIWDVFLKGHMKAMPFAEYLDMVEAAGETNAFYMTAADRLLWQPGLRSLLDDIVIFPGFLDATRLKRQVSLWFGPAGTVSPLHRDEVNVFLCQAVGHKRVRLITSKQVHRVYNRRSFFSEVDLERPDLARHPRFEGLRQHDVTIGPGDVLFIPVGWWHHVRSLDVSISVALTNFTRTNDLPIAGFFRRTHERLH